MRDRDREIATHKDITSLCSRRARDSERDRQREASVWWSNIPILDRERGRLLAMAMAMAMAMTDEQACSSRTHTHERERERRAHERASDTRHLRSYTSALTICVACYLSIDLSTKSLSLLSSCCLAAKPTNKPRVSLMYRDILAGDLDIFPGSYLGWGAERKYHSFGLCHFPVASVFVGRRRRSSIFIIVRRSTHHTQHSRSLSLALSCSRV